MITCFRITLAFAEYKRDERKYEGNRVLYTNRKEIEKLQKIKLAFFYY
jgi:hypothetical protein